MREHEIGERLEARLLGDLRLGAALRLERQIDVLEPALAVGATDRRLERVVELSLLADRLENGGAPVLELAQIAQAVVERAQLRIIERAGRLLTVASDERNRGASVEQFHGGGDLLGAHAELASDLLGDFLRDLMLSRSCRRNGHAYTCTKEVGIRDGVARSSGAHI